MRPLRRSTIVILMLSVWAIFSWLWFFAEYRRNHAPMPFPPNAIPLGAAALEGQPAGGKDILFSIQILNPTDPTDTTGPANSPDSPESYWITLAPRRDDPLPAGEQGKRLARWITLWFTALPNSDALTWPVIGRVIAGSQAKPVSMDLLYLPGTPPTPGQIAFRWQGQTYPLPPGPEANTCAEEIAAHLAPGNSSPP